MANATQGITNACTGVAGWAEFKINVADLNPVMRAVVIRRCLSPTVETEFPDSASACHPAARSGQTLKCGGRFHRRSLAIRRYILGREHCRQTANGTTKITKPADQYE